jgi:hypothetical protein
MEKGKLFTANFRRYSEAIHKKSLSHSKFNNNFERGFKCSQITSDRVSKKSHYYVIKK